MYCIVKYNISVHKTCNISLKTVKSQRGENEKEDNYKIFQISLCLSKWQTYTFHYNDKRIFLFAHKQPKDFFTDRHIFIESLIHMDRCLNLIHVPGSGILDGGHLGKRWRDCNSGLWAAETLDTCQTMVLKDKEKKHVLKTKMY